MSARLCVGALGSVAKATKWIPDHKLQQHLKMTRPLHKMPSAARLEELIDEATIDCYGEDEQHTGLLTMIEEHVVCPFRAKVIGETVEVTGFRWPDSGHGLLAVCRRNEKTHRLNIDALEWIEPLPQG